MQILIFKDKKFITAALDVVISLVMYFGAKYANPGLMDDVKVIIGALQPLALMVITSLYQAENAAIRAGILPDHIRQVK